MLRLSLNLGLASLLLLLFSPVAISAQSQTFTKDDLEYVLELPAPQWRAVTRLDIHSHLEFVYGDDPASGRMRVRKRLVDAGTTATELFARDEKLELQSLPGYVVCSAGNGTRIDGGLNGTVFSYEYTNRGRSMDGRIYYLEIDKRTFYALHFTVASDKLQQMREQADAIARSFRLK